MGGGESTRILIETVAMKSRELKEHRVRKNRELSKELEKQKSE